MINIEYPDVTKYWILKNNDNYEKGQTDPGQVTTAGDFWSIHLLTTDKNEWEQECLLLGLD